MTGAYSKVVIESCPYEYDIGCELYRPGARLSMPDLMDMALHFSLPSGTEFTWRGVRYLWYGAVRYTLTEDGDVDESSAARVVQDDSTSYHPQWRRV